MSAAHLEPGPLGLPEVLLIGSSLTAYELLECDGSPFDALIHGTRSGGQCWSVLDGSTPIGAMGWTDHGTIWSLWAPLRLAQKVAILKHTRLWVRAMLQASGREFLFNHVHRDNAQALSWLHRSQCFLIDYRPVQTNNLPTYFFRTQPLEKLL